MQYKSSHVLPTTVSYFCNRLLLNLSHFPGMLRNFKIDLHVKELLCFRVTVVLLISAGNICQDSPLTAQPLSFLLLCTAEEKDGNGSTWRRSDNDSAVVTEE